MSIANHVRRFVTDLARIIAEANRLNRLLKPYRDET